jgi:MoxR-like ATPase
VYEQAIREMRAEGLEFSDRRVVRGLKLVAGAALLRGSRVAEPADLWPMRYCWTRPEDMPTVRRILAPHLGADAAAFEPQRPVDEINDELTGLHGRASAARREGQVIALLNEYNKLRRELLRDHPDNTDLLRRAEADIAELMERLNQLE